MGFAVVRCERGPFGERIGEKQALRIGLPTRAEAVALIEEWLGTLARHGYGEDLDRWWYEDGERLFQLTVEA